MSLDELAQTLPPTISGKELERLERSMVSAMHASPGSDHGYTPEQLIRGWMEAGIAEAQIQQALRTFQGVSDEQVASANADLHDEIASLLQEAQESLPSGFKYRGTHSAKGGGDAWLRKPAHCNESRNFLYAFRKYSVPIDVVALGLKGEFTYEHHPFFIIRHEVAPKFHTPRTCIWTGTDTRQHGRISMNKYTLDTRLSIAYSQQVNSGVEDEFLPYILAAPEVIKDALVECARRKSSYIEEVVHR